MGAAGRLSSMLENLRNVLAIELLAACQGIEFLAPLETGPHAQKAQELVRSVSSRVEKDRSLSTDIAAESQLIAGGEFERVLKDAFAGPARGQRLRSLWQCREGEARPERNLRCLFYGMLPGQNATEAYLARIDSWKRPGVASSLNGDGIKA